MLKSLTWSIAVAAAIALGSPALAQEMSVTIKSYNSSARTIVVEDGTTYILGEGVTVRELKPGSKVKLMIEEKGGKRVVTKVIE
jgi:Protein of unknown function (DUF1344)